MTANDDIEKGELIGLDHYWDIVIGNPIRDTQNLVAMEKSWNISYPDQFTQKYIEISQLQHFLQT